MSCYCGALGGSQNPKFQAPNSKEIRNSKYKCSKLSWRRLLAVLVIEILVFGHSLGFGAWNLGFQLGGERPATERRVRVAGLRLGVLVGPACRAGPGFVFVIPAVGRDQVRLGKPDLL